MFAALQVPGISGQASWIHAAELRRIKAELTGGINDCSVDSGCLERMQASSTPWNLTSQKLFHLHYLT